MASKGAKNPNKTGMRCIICRAYEVREGTQVLIEHEKHCPDYRR